MVYDDVAGSCDAADAREGRRVLTQYSYTRTAASMAVPAFTGRQR